MTTQGKSTSWTPLEEQASTSRSTQDQASPQTSLQNTIQLTKFEKLFKFRYTESILRLFKKLSTEEKRALANATLPNNVRPLVDAVLGQNEGMVKFLLECGAEPNQTAGLDAQPLLHWAVFKGNEAIVRLLIQYGAELNWTPPDSPPGMTALGAACSLGDRKLVRLLLRKGAALEARDFRGETCIFHALRSNKRKLVKLLLKRGASKDVNNIYGENPVEQADRYWPELVVKLKLRKWYQPVRNVDTSKTNSSHGRSEKKSSTAECITETIERASHDKSALNKNDSQTYCSSSDSIGTVSSDSSYVDADDSFSVGKINSSATEYIRDATMRTCHYEQLTVNEKDSFPNSSHSSGRTGTVLSDYSYRESNSPANECTTNAPGRTRHEETSRPIKICSENVSKDRKSATCSKFSEKKPPKKAFTDSNESSLVRMKKKLENKANRKDVDICESLQKAVLMGMPPTPSLHIEDDDSSAALSEVSSPGPPGEDTSSVPAHGHSTGQTQCLSFPSAAFAEVSNCHSSTENQSGNLSEGLNDNHFQDTLSSSQTLHELGRPSAVKEHSQESSTVENSVNSAKDQLIQSLQLPGRRLEDNPVHQTEDPYSLMEEERKVWANQFLT